MRVMVFVKATEDSEKGLPPTDEAHDRALPWRSVIVMMVLLNEACT